LVNQVVQEDPMEKPLELDNPMTPGDESPRGIEGTGAGLCPDCGGTGRKQGQECKTCHGSGQIVPLG
jgi:hypothetical protein